MKVVCYETEAPGVHSVSLELPQHTITACYPSIYAEAIDENRGNSMFPDAAWLIYDFLHG